MTKREAKARKAEWIKAVADGRIVRYADVSGWSFRKFPTADLARAFAAEFILVTGQACNIVVPS